MKIHFLLFILIFCNATWASNDGSKKVSTPPLPQWLKHINVPSQDAIHEDECSGGIGYLLYDRQHHLEKREWYTHFVYKIITDEGVEDASSISLSFDPSYQQLKIHHVNIVRDGKIIPRLKKNKIKITQNEPDAKYHIYDGRLTATLIIPGTRKGDIIDYAYTKTGSNPIFDGKYYGEFTTQFSVPVLYQHIRIITDPSRELNIKYRNNAEKASVSEQNGLKTMEWELSDNSVLIQEENVPSWFNPNKQILISEFENWEEVVKWGLNIYKTDEQQNKALTQFINQLKKEPTKEEQLVKALDFVQNEIRYVGLEDGIGAIKPFPPAEVFEKRYGDCKDKTLLLCYILNKLSIKAWPVLINSSERKFVTEYPPGGRCFDHIVTVVQLNGKTLWYDATISQQGGKYDNRWFPDYQYGLVIREGDIALTHIPYTSDYRMEIEDYYETHTYDSTWINYRVTTDYWGGKADDMRRWFQDRSKKEINKLYLDYYTNNFKQISLDSSIVYTDDLTNNHFQTIERYRIKNFWEKVDTTDQSTLKAFVYPQPIRDELEQYGTDRKMPLRLDFPTDLHQRIIMKMPDTWSITPEVVTFNDAGIEYKSNVWDADTTIYFDYHYKVTADHCPASKAETNRNITDKIIDDLGYNLTYDPYKASRLADYRINYPLLLLGILIFSFSLYMAFRYFQSVQRPFDNSENLPMEIGGWLVLVAITVAIAPLVRAFELFDGDYINQATWEGISSSDYTSYNSKLAFLYVVEYAYNILILVFSVLTAILFFQRRKEAPGLLKILYLAFALSAIIISSGLVWAGTSEFDFETIKDIIQKSITACIWIPYFTYSTRVKATFVK